MTPTDKRKAPADRHGHGESEVPAHHYSEEELHNEDVAHEASDINIRVIFLSGVGLFVVTAICAVAMLVLFNVLDRQAAANDPAMSPLALPAGQLPPEPRLQTNEPAVLEKLRDREMKTLAGYGWVDQQRGVAHIPIAEAKKKILERGLPSRPDAPPPALGTNAPAMAEPSGGRTIK